MKSWTIRARRVATKYLPNYLGWYRMLDRLGKTSSAKDIFVAALGLNGSPLVLVIQPFFSNRCILLDITLLGVWFRVSDPIIALLQDGPRQNNDQGGTLRKFTIFGRVATTVGTIATMTALVAVGPAWASTASSSSSTVQKTKVLNSSSLLLPARWTAEAQQYVTEGIYNDSLNPTFRSIASPVGFETVSGGPSPELRINPGGSCNSSLGNVHLSTYYPGNVDSKASVTCNSPQSQISITVDLYRDYANVFDLLVATQTRTADNIAQTKDITAFFYCSGTGIYTYYSVAHYSVDLDGRQISWTAITPNQTITC